MCPCATSSGVKNVSVASDNSPSTLSSETCSEAGSPYRKRRKFVNEVPNIDKECSTYSSGTGSKVASPGYRGSKVASLTISSSKTTQSNPSFSGSQKRKRTLRYYGDVRRHDINTVRRRKAWQLFQTTILSQRKKIISLQQTNRRLKSKVVSLKSQLHPTGKYKIRINKKYTQKHSEVKF